MACMDHECVSCGHAWMDNAFAHGCPKCGERVTNDFDESTEHDDPPDWLDEHEYEPLDGAADDD